MDLCIKTVLIQSAQIEALSFNPCFNGTMYKNFLHRANVFLARVSFNPCFNGTMYKNAQEKITNPSKNFRFNPCFNGTMYKNTACVGYFDGDVYVSILVLMELCIKTVYRPHKDWET